MYDVRIRNSYFEQIDSVKLGSHYIGKIETRNDSESFFVTKGMYDFSCITQSELVVTTEVNIQGLNEQIIIKLNERGKIELE